MSISIQQVGIRYSNPTQKGFSAKSNGQNNVSFKSLLSTREDKFLAGIGGAGAMVATAGILNKLGIEGFAAFDFPVVITALCACLPFIAALGIFGCKTKTA